MWDIEIKNHNLDHFRFQETHTFFDRHTHFQETHTFFNRHTHFLA